MVTDDSVPDEKPAREERKVEGMTSLRIPATLLSHIHTARVCELPEPYADSGVPFYASEPKMHVYQLSSDGPAGEEIEGMQNLRCFH
jgi:hypothetical protein